MPTGSELETRPHQSHQKPQSKVRFDDNDISFGVPLERVRSLVEGNGISNIQTTVVSPTEDSQTLWLVPGFHRQLHSWLQSSLEMRYGDEYNRFGQPQELTVRSGDLVITLPQILRWSKGFSSPNLLHLSQYGLGNRFRSELPNSSNNCLIERSSDIWDQSAVHHDNKIEEAEGPWDSDQTLDGRSGSSCSIAKALNGRLQWTNDGATEERMLFLGHMVLLLSILYNNRRCSLQGGSMRSLTALRGSSTSKKVFALHMTYHHDTKSTYRS